MQLAVNMSDLATAVLAPYLRSLGLHSRHFTGSALPCHGYCNFHTSQAAVFKHIAIFEERPGRFVKTKHMPSL